MPDDAKTQVVTRLLDGTTSIPAPQPPTCHCGTAMTRTQGGWVCEREISRDGDRIQICGTSIESSLPPLAAMRVDDARADGIRGSAESYGESAGLNETLDLLADRAEMVRELARLREAVDATACYICGQTILSGHSVNCSRIGFGPPYRREKPVPRSE